MLDREILLEEFAFYKQRAVKAYEELRFEESLLLVQFCAYITWTFPILYNFIDDDLEALLQKIASSIVLTKKTSNQNEQSKKAVLYAGQLIDNGALTEQYLTFLIENDYNILIVVPDITKTILAPDTIKYLSGIGNVELYIAPKTTLTHKIGIIFQKIIDFNPEICFLHFLPNDVVGYCVFSKIKAPTKYFIVHNDHTFWLGKNCSDIFLEFRNFGYLITAIRRGIDSKKIKVIPYYPINNKVEFEGFPFDRSGKIVGVSGANLYKYLADPELKYFYAIKKLLESNSNFVFCLCGWGNAEKILRIFDDPNILNQFYFLGKRSDFYSLVGNCDILFESYPLKGGLTVLFATEQRKCVIGIGDPRNPSGMTKDFLNIPNYAEPMNIDDFIDEAQILIKSEVKRKQNSKVFSNNSFNKKDFSRSLKSIIDWSDVESKTLNQMHELTLDDDYYLNEYLLQPEISNTLYGYKLAVLKDVLSLQQRLRTALKLCNLSEFKRTTYKRMARILFLTVFGK